MPGGVVCYIERSGGGSMIRRVRLVAAGLSRVWTAPEGSAVSSVEGAPGGPGPAVNAARSSAQWVAQTIEGLGLKRLHAVCADADGSVCAWLSAPSPESKVVEATIAQSAADTDGSGAGVGAARLIALSAGAAPGAMGDVSVQALATMEPPKEEPELKERVRTSLKRRSAAGSVRKSRYAVLAIPDAPIRVFLDELDRLGVECESVMALWHAMAAAWDPDRRGATGGGRDVAGDQPSAAVVLVEPSGRLVWSWTLAGELVAGGTMRLASITRSAPAAPESDALATTDAAKRVENEEEPEPTLDFSSADAGRLVMDWLAWSAQLGQCPQRVVCLSCPTLSSGDGGGPESIARLLAKVWPNATIDGAVHDDPVGATVARLAGLGNEEDLPAPALEDRTPAALRPRAALIGLSARPGRADRSLHVWIAAALFAMALVIGAAAFQVHRSIADVTDSIGKMVERKKKVQAELGAAINQPRFADMQPDQQNDAVASAVKMQRDQIARLKPGRPVFKEMLRLIHAMDGLDDVKIAEFQLNNVAALVTVNVPDADSGPEILDRLNKAPGVLKWEGSIPTSRGGTQRQYRLMATWPEKIDVPVPAAPASANPAAPANGATPAPDGSGGAKP